MCRLGVSTVAKFKSCVTLNHDKLFHLIEVRDNGIGFEQSDTERIFNVLHTFMAMQNTEVLLLDFQSFRKSENHGGCIWAESKLDEVSTFFILLPVSILTAFILQSN
ncbi:MAG: hypothetical protein JWN41_1823 [Thermoleophilia bacterium]|nr:hypothetical protein [Thermoleophilia bacterium]